MACKEVSREINGKQCFCRQWSATKAMVMKARLIQLGGDDIIPFADGIADIVSMFKLEQTAKPEELVGLIKDFVCAVRVDGAEVTPATFDMTYSGELWEVVQLFTFACEVNFKDFFAQGVVSMDDQPR